jgi:hypothetical protein
MLKEAVFSSETFVCTYRSSLLRNPENQHNFLHFVYKLLCCLSASITHANCWMQPGGQGFDYRHYLRRSTKPPVPKGLVACFASVKELERVKQSGHSCVSAIVIFIDYNDRFLVLKFREYFINTLNQSGN